MRASGRLFTPPTSGQHSPVRVEVQRTRRLRFDDGTPVRAASGLAAYLDGHLVVQDDSTHAALVRPASVTPVRVLPPVEGHDRFSEPEGTKHLKPDLEAAVALADDDVLLLGSGSSPARTRLARLTPDGPVVRDVAPLYATIARALALPAGTLNLEGACLVGDRLRWFQRGAARLPSASVDVELTALLGGAGTVTMAGVRTYDLGEVDGVALAVTDALALGDGRVLVSTAAEDTDDPVDDGPVVASGLALLDGEAVVDRALLPADGGVHKVEGLALLSAEGSSLTVLAVVDDDDHESPSTELVLRVDL